MSEHMLPGGPRASAAPFALEMDLFTRIPALPNLDPFSPTDHEMIASCVRALQEDNPYVGKEVVIITNDDLHLTHQDTGEVRYINEGEVMCRLEGFDYFFNLSDEDHQNNYGLSAVLSFPESENEGYGCHLDADKIRDIWLQDDTHPFWVEAQWFDLALNDVIRQKLSYDETTDFFDAFINELNQHLRTKKATVEFDVCEYAELLVTMFPPQENQNTEADFDEDIEDALDAHDYMDFRGRIRGEVLELLIDWEDEDERSSPRLSVRIMLDREHPLVTGDGWQYVEVLVEDISHGSVVQGPFLN